MSSGDSSSDDGSRGNDPASASDDESAGDEHREQQRSIGSPSDDAQSDSSERGHNRDGGKESSPEMERQLFGAVTEDGNDSDAPSERHSQAANDDDDDDDDSDPPSERQPVPAVSDDSDAVSERQPDGENDSVTGDKDDSDDGGGAGGDGDGGGDGGDDDGSSGSSTSEADENEAQQRPKDGAFSDNDSDKKSDEEDRKELTEDDIVGPRLYPDPDAGVVEPERLEPTIVEVSTARICPKFTDEGLYFVKFPNFLSIEPRPFDQEHYEDEFDEDDLLDEEGRARLKLRVENTIRWRYVLDDDGNIQKQGNSKVVRWSDGTMSLYLGGEIFDIAVQPMQLDNHLFLRQGAGLQGHAVFREKLGFRPHSTDSITHRKVTLSMADRSNKSQKVKVLTAVGLNPESKKAEIVRKEEERMRAQNRREAQQRRNRMRPSLGRSGLTASFLEDRDEESDEESISAIKNRYKHGLDDRPLIGHSDSEDSDSKRLHDAKKDSEDSDSDQERRKQKKKKVIIEDDDDDDN